jgi:hypothetical protein
VRYDWLDVRLYVSARILAKVAWRRGRAFIIKLSERDATPKSFRARMHYGIVVQAKNHNHRALWLITDFNPLKGPSRLQLLIRIMPSDIRSFFGGKGSQIASQSQESPAKANVGVCASSLSILFFVYITQ